MLDPFPPPPPALARLTAPLAARLDLPTLPLHIHEALGAFSFYLFAQLVISPRLARLICPKIYNGHNRRTQINWDVHFVAFVQACIISGLSLWVMLADKERAAMSPTERVWGYSGALGMLQAMALGYFIWDIGVCTIYFRIFGIGMFMHAVSALSVFTLGFRPFLNFYGPNFLLYELSSTFLNLHWFCDKWHMTGSWLQLVNGIFLLVTFGCTRLLWGTWHSFLVYRDAWVTWQAGPFVLPEALDARNLTASDTVQPAMMRETYPPREVLLYTAPSATFPLAITIVYMLANLVLNLLNFYWFSHMIEAVTKRFRKPAKEKVVQAQDQAQVELDEKGETITAERTEVRRRRP